MWSLISKEENYHFANLPLSWGSVGQGLKHCLTRAMALEFFPKWKRGKSSFHCMISSSKIGSPQDPRGWDCFVPLVFEKRKKKMKFFQICTCINNYFEFCWSPPSIEFPIQLYCVYDVWGLGTSSQPSESMFGGWLWTKPNQLTTSANLHKLHTWFLECVFMRGVY